MCETELPTGNRTRSLKHFVKKILLAKNIGGGVDLTPPLVNRGLILGINRRLTDYERFSL